MNIRLQKLRELNINGIWQLTVCFLLLFVFPLFNQQYNYLLYLLGLIALMFVSAAMLKKNRKPYFIIATIITISRLLAKGQEVILILNFIDISAILYFAWISIVLINQVIQREEGISVIIDAIAGYLLLGISLTLIMSAILYFVPDSFAFNGEIMKYAQDSFAINSYYVFITYSSVGYGDIIPINDVARSFAKLTALCGQIYISVVIAILVGKNLMVRPKSHKED